MINILHIGTRGSKLALIQAETVKSLLAKNGVASELVIVKTSGDSFTDKPFREAGIGAFVREIDDRMLSGDIDAAVHSMKDVPTKRPKGIGVCAVLPRASPYDVLIFERPVRDGGVIGTSSLRRHAQLARYFPQYIRRQIRGNVDTRMRKLKASEFSAIVLAEAGLERLGVRINKKRLPFVPSPNQGIIAIMASEEIREYEVISALNDRATYVEAMVERVIMETLGGGCLVPLGVFAQLQGDSIGVTAEVLSLDGQRAVRLADHVSVENYDHDSRAIALRIKENGGEALIAEAIGTGFNA
ncbi:MAG: hydroxymethylbilane synthase [Halobacteriota archaeon]